MHNRIRVGALPALVLVLSALTACGSKETPSSQPSTAPVSPPPSNPNIALELSGAGIGHLEVQLSGKEIKEPLRFEFKADNGQVVGGIELPKEAPTDYVITAFNAEGESTHTGKGTIPGFAQLDRPLLLPLHPENAGDGLVVSLARERIVLEARRSDKPDGLVVRAQVLDARGKPTGIGPGDLTWQLSNGRLINLIPNRNDLEVAVVPANNVPMFELCPLVPQVTMCLPNMHCKPIRVCADPYVKISAGHLHTCALTQSGSAFCWGSNLQGQLGKPTTTTCGNNAPNCSSRPLAVACPAGAPCKFKQISAGQTLTAAVDTNGDVWWWGRGSPTHHKVNAVLASGVVKFALVAAGFGHACAISQARSEIWCWGANGYGETGVARTVLDVSDAAPFRVLVPSKFRRIVASGEHTCAIGQTGVDVVCWGRDDENQSSGPNSSQISATGTATYFFQRFGGLVQILNVAASQNTTCVTLPSGVRCWGANAYYNVTGFGAPDLLTAGLGQICAVTAQQAKCMGTNNWGELGIGSNAYQTAPVAVKTPPPLYSDLSAGDTHTCGVTPAGDAFCWGNNLYGQVGNGTTNYNVKEPTQVVTP